MFTSTSWDTIVVGAGPGGSSAAAICAGGGLKTLLVERSEAPQFKIGESLMPETYWVFKKMGALQALKDSHFTRKHSVQFFTRTGKSSAPYYFDYGRPGDDSARTWQVRRAEFDQLLMDVAAEQGAEVHRGVNVRDVLFEDGRAVGVLAVPPGGGEPVELRSKVVIDATGQSALLARQLGLGRIDYDLRHAGIFTHIRGAHRDEGRAEGATLVLHTQPGDCWFWYIPLSGDTVSVGVVGPVDSLLKGRQGRPHEIFHDEVRRCPELEWRIRSGHQCRPISVLRDFSYRLKKMAGDGWVAIGDAFSFIDPVYSSGVMLALESGAMVAEATIGAVENDDTSGERLGAFEPRLLRGVRAVHRMVTRFYDPHFSFGGFTRRYPHHQRGVTRVLSGDVFKEDFDEMFADMATFGADMAAEGAQVTAPTPAG